MSKILVIGSSNIDLVANVKTFPKAGETIKGLSLMHTMGGKGANQAVAAHKLGGNVEFITCLGDDSYGEKYLDYFRKEGVNISSSVVVEDINTGIAIILVDENGENCIVIEPGANKKLSSENIPSLEKSIAEADFVLLQMEIPYETVSKVCTIAKNNNKTVILNVAPAYPLTENILKNVDILVVNKTEAELITGQEVDVVGKDVIMGTLIKMGAKTVILTLGDKGCILKSEEFSYSIPAFRVKAIDTTAAGDTFCGAIAAELSRENNFVKALKFASAASAISVTRMGAQPSIPNEKEVREFLKNNN